MKKIIAFIKKIHHLALNPYLYYGYLTLIVVGSLILWVSHFTANILITEMIISFLPLGTILQTIGLVVGLLWTIIFFNDVSKVRIITGVVLLACTVSWGFNLTGIWDYAAPQFLYSATWNKDINPKDTTIDLRVGFFNKAFWNNDIQKLSDQVHLLQLDVLGIAEISPEEYNALKLQLPLPNTYFTTCKCQSDIGSEVAIFSRYPLSNIQANFIAKTPILQADIAVQNKLLHTIVTHPYAPITSQDLAQRNLSLDQLAKHLNSMPDRQSMVMGDFNTASWSWTYKNFLVSLPHMRDANRGGGLASTWNSGFFHTIIDHMLVSANVSVQHFSILPDKLNSDHHLLWAEIQL